MNRRGFCVWLLALGLGCGWSVEAAGPWPGRLAPAQGLLLVASEDMADPRFARSVILLVNYQVEGVAGIILNRPTTVRVDEVLPGAPDGEQPLFYGGPVAPGVLLGLLQSSQPPPGATPVAGELHLLRPDRLPPQVQPSERLRLVLGFAGWSIAQLAGEIERGDWYVLPLPEGVLSTPPERLWELLRRPGREIWI